MKRLILKIKLIVPAALILYLGLVPVAHANFLVDVVTDIGLTAVFKAVSGVNFLIGYIGGIFVFLGGNLTNWTLNLNSQVIQSPTVKVGWVIARDLANLGFVLAIILIAFATILRMESYEMKKTLRNLIIAALLINFSLVIAGVFVDFAGVITDFFIDKATGGTLAGAAKIGEAFANGFQVQKFIQVTKDSKSIEQMVAGLTGVALVSFAASLFFVALFTAIAAISLFGLAGMLFIRYIALNILLVIMPLAWLFWIWPDLQGKWKEWWSEFFRWVFFAPAASFFIYLALSLASSKYSGDLALGGAEQTLNPGGALGLLVDNVGQIIGQMIAVLGVLIGGLITANKMGIYGADIALKTASAASNTILRSPITTGGFGAGRAYQLATGKTVSESLRGVTSRFSGTPIIGGAMQAANRALVTGTKARMDDYNKKFGAMDKEARLRAINNPLLINEEEKAALMETITEKNELKDLRGMIGKSSLEGGISQDKFESLIKASFARSGDTGKAILSKDPGLAGLKIPGASLGNRKAYFDNPEVKAEIAKAMKFMKPEVAEFVDVEVFKENPEAIAQLKPNFLSRFLNERELDSQETLVNHINNHLKKIENKEAGYTEEIKNKIIGIGNLILNSPTWQFKPKSKLLKRRRGGGPSDEII